MGFKLTDEFIIDYKIDRLGVIFALLVAVMYLLIAVYQVGYFRHDRHKKSYMVFYCLSFLAIMSEFFAANLITMYISFEFVTFTTVMFVFHDRNREARRGAFRNLYFSMAGAFTALAGVFILYSGWGTNIGFAKGGFFPKEFLDGDEKLFFVAAFLMLLGFGVKTATLPFQAWLPAAHPVAPAPGSAALSGIVVKCGAFAVIRTVYYLFGTEFLRGTWVQTAWMALSIVTIFLGSMLAYREKVFKKRLAYSTISQMNYIMFGLSLLSVSGIVGAMLHVIMHSMVKITLFLVAGNLIHQTGKRRVDEYEGLGRKMPITFVCYTIAAVTLVGIPPSGTFLSKWYFSRAALAATANSGLAFAGVIVLMVSALLTAGYLFPIFIRGFYPGESFEEEKTEKCEAPYWMTIPLIILVVMIVVLGVYPNLILSQFDDLIVGLI